MRRWRSNRITSPPSQDWRVWRSVIDLWGNAERYLRRAIATGTSDRDVLKLMRDVMHAAAAQRWPRRSACA